MAGSAAEMSADPASNARADPSRGLHGAWYRADDVLRCLERGRGESAPQKRQRARPAHLAGAQDFGACDAFGKRQALVDDVGAAQKDHQQTAHRGARRTQHRDVAVGQRAGLAQHHQRGKSEDRARRDRFSGRGYRLHHVVFENRRAAERSQHRHRDHRGRDARRDGQPGVQPEVRVGRTEQQRECKAKHDRARRDLARRGIEGLRRCSG